MHHLCDTPTQHPINKACLQWPVRQEAALVRGPVWEADADQAAAGRACGTGQQTHARRMGRLEISPRQQIPTRQPPPMQGSTSGSRPHTHQAATTAPQAGSLPPDHSQQAPPASPAGGSAGSASAFSLCRRRSAASDAALAASAASASALQLKWGANCMDINLLCC